MSKKREDESKPEAPVDAARRRLLGMALYVPPVVLGAISLSQAGCQPDPNCSCEPNPASCPPPTPKPPSNGPAAPAGDNAGANPTPEG